MSQRYLTILTPYGQSALLNALNGGETIKLSHMAVGGGGGAEYTPAEGQAALLDEVFQTELSDIYIDADNPNWIVCEAYIPADVGAFWIREIAVKDENLETFAVGSWPEQYKPVLSDGAATSTLLKFILQVSNTECIELAIDNSTLFVTQDQLARHIEDTDVHGAAYEAEPLRLMMRDAGGRVQAAKPVRPDDVARLKEISDVIGAMGHLTDSGVPLAVSYTGDGVTGAFEMTGLVSDAPQAILVTLDGIAQAWAEDYTVDLDGIPTVIFAAPPPDGAAIRMRTMVTLTQAFNFTLAVNGA